MPTVQLMVGTLPRSVKALGQAWPARCWPSPPPPSSPAARLPSPPPAALPRGPQAPPAKQALIQHKDTMGQLHQRTSGHSNATAKLNKYNVGRFCHELS